MGSCLTLKWSRRALLSVPSPLWRAAHLKRLDDELFRATETYEIIASYPEDKYLPSYLVWATSEAGAFHALFAADIDKDNVRIVTAYRPHADEWESDLKSRKGQK